MAHTRLPSSSSLLSPLGSPPSLTFSERSEDTEDAMDINGGHREDANVVMQKVLGPLDQVVEHLRDKQENEAANEIAISTVTIVKAFNDATAPWDFEKFYMNPRKYLRKPVVGLSNGTSQASAITMGSSWASVAATEADYNNKWIKFRPSDGLQRNVSDEVIIEAAEQDQDMRVVWVAEWGVNRPLGEVTNFLSQGPIFSMVYSPENNAVCIIFQNASSAQTLLEDESLHQERRRASMFGARCTVVPGLPYPEDEEIRRMGNPINERRRLTFARSQLFAHGMTEEQFKRDIYHDVGEQNVELVWLFNTGNATVVFTSTAIARRIRDRFRQEAKRNGPYRDVHVSFSHDPCEKPMNLITQIPAGAVVAGSSSSTSSQVVPGLSRSSSTRRGNGSSKGGLSRSPSKRSQVQVDADGWQTVAKRR